MYIPTLGHEAAKPGPVIVNYPRPLHIQPLPREAPTVPESMAPSIHAHEHARAESCKYLDFVQCSPHVMRDLAPIAQEVFVPTAELAPIVFRLVLLVPLAEFGCKSWLSQGYGHQLLSSAHPANNTEAHQLCL